MRREAGVSTPARSNGIDIGFSRGGTYFTILLGTVDFSRGLFRPCGERGMQSTSFWNPSAPALKLPIMYSGSDSEGQCNDGNFSRLL